MLEHKQLVVALENCIDGVELGSGFGRKSHGKVREIYTQDDRLILITSDRVSAFDRVLGLIPYKGQVLNQLSAWWFAQTNDIVDNHVQAVPHPNVTVADKAEMLPIEVVVRGYITGVTDTSIWTMYANGDRAPYGIPLPDGLRKNDPLPTPIITPTTKAEQGAHDEKVTEAELLERGVVSPELWQDIRTTALALFQRGQQLAAKGGLILVDTKYEFGLLNGNLVICDELHTPDSSRYWLASSYDETRQPVNMSKEFLREWFAEQGYKGEGKPPTMPDDFRAQVASRYIDVYEKLTGQTFQPATETIADSLTPFGAPLVGVIMGSTSDWETMRHAHEALEALGVPHECKVVSAHRTPQLTAEYATSAEKRGLEVIIAGAGGAAHLPGMTAAETPLPVLGVPVQSRALNGLDSLLSIVQMPRGIPVGTLSIGASGAKNAALLAVAILGNKYPEYRAKLKAMRVAQTEAVLASELPLSN